ncbi:MAG TPA: hypothetical protein VFH89_11840 [Sphingomicrobium sp.]|nr:hypothetical protein [Sphingomicrobium sp.]
MTRLQTFLAAFLVFTAASLGGCQAKMESGGADENAVANMAATDEWAQNASDESNAAATEAGQPLPEFKIPAPRPSAQMVLPRALLPPGEPTLQQVDDALHTRLTAGGYDRVGYYRVTNGFALATQMERIASDGKPYTDAKRWATEASGLASASEGLSLASMMNALFHADPGSYRVLVFVVTNRPVTSTAAAMSSDVAKEMVVEGPADLPQGFAEARFGPDYRVTVLIYEFNRTSVGKPAQFSRPSIRSAAEQLRLAKVLEG